VVLPAKGPNCIGCFANQVKLAYALVRDLDKAVKEIQQFGNHGEEASRKITELEALCKQKEDVVKKPTKEKAKLEGMVQSRDELIMEMADKYGLKCMGEDTDDEDEDDEDNREDAAAPLAVTPPPVPTPPAAAPEVIIIEEEENPVEMVLEQGAPEELEIIVPEAEPQPP
jgi:hypothetical protein